MIRLVGVSKRFESTQGPVDALLDVDLHLREGEFVALRGPSGSGKSTLLALVAGLDRPTRGVVEVAGARIDSMSVRDSARFRAEKIGLVFQRIHLAPYLSILENALIGGGGKDRRDRAAGLLEQFGLKDRMDHLPGRLSVGECQRAALARALVHRPSLLLADEPTGNLDPDSAAVVLSALRDFRSAGGTVLLVTHETEAASHADRTAWLSKGGVVDGV